MTRSPKPLYQLLLVLFRSNDDLYALLANLPYSRAEDLVATLPGPTVPRTTFAMYAVQQLQAHGLDTEAFFTGLSERFPTQGALIENARKHYLWEQAPEPDPSEAREPDLGSPPSSAAADAFEKIIGERPTFLDVWYLALGYERARAVAKLRMRFSSGWYSGTAFLVEQHTLLTAHHNAFMPNGEKASQIEAIFDYEGSADGPEREGTTVQCTLANILGEQADDWALLQLAEPLAARPLIPLSDEPVQIGERVAIIQHPGGMVKQVALHNNLVTHVDCTRVQYLTDTLPGSSGSPVFDRKWRAVAVHHAGGSLPLPGTKQTVYRNQGIPIAHVRARATALGAQI